MLSSVPANPAFERTGRRKRCGYAERSWRRSAAQLVPLGINIHIETDCEH